MSASVQSYWQQTWEGAEPGLRRLKDKWGSLSSTPRVLRVGQLDAELLDEELIQTLREPLAKACTIVDATFRSKLEPELALIIRLALYKFSIWDLGATYGAKLQDLRYQVDPSSAANRSLSPSGLPKRTLAAHAILTVLVPYIYVRLRNHALSNAWPDTPSSDRRRKAWNLLNGLESLHVASALMSFVIFLLNGRYRTLADRLLSMRLVPSRRLVNRQVSFEFMNRQMVWHAFTEFLLLVLPVFSSRAFRRLCNQLNSRVRSIDFSFLLPSSKNTLPSEWKGSSSTMKKGRFLALPLDQCAICADNASFSLTSLSSGGGEDSFRAYLDSSVAAASDESEPPLQEESAPPKYPITTPYTASCGHEYCYFCLSERLIRAVDDGDDGWECLRCTKLVRSCERDRVSFEGDSPQTSGGWDSGTDDVGLFESDMSLGSESDQT